MIEVFYTRFTEKLPAKNYQQLLAQLSANMQQQVSNFRKWEDAHRSLLGKALFSQFPLLQFVINAIFFLVAQHLA